MPPLAPSLLVCGSLVSLVGLLRALLAFVERNVHQQARAEGPVSPVESAPLIVISYARCVQFSVACAFFGLVWCVAMAIAFDFRGSTSTHCSVLNFLPSISAAVAGRQVYMWRMCVAVMTAQRFFDAFVYFEYFRGCKKAAQHISPQTLRLCFCLTFEQLLFVHLSSQLGEHIGLVLLTSVSSRDNFPLHALGFTAFIVGSLLHMQSAMQLHSAGPLSPKQRYSLWWKVALVRANLLCAAVAAVFYALHNTFCVPGLYSLFALAEYGYVCTNILFNGLGCIDFSDLTLTLA